MKRPETDIPALKLTNVSKSFDALQVLTSISFSVPAGQRRALLGPNGAGKTTLFHMISGELDVTTGSVELFGQELTRLKPHQRVRLGLCRTFQRNNLFLNLTLWENVRLAAQVRSMPMGSLWRPADRCQNVNEETEAVLEQLGLADRRHVRAADLSYGEQRQLELAMALAGKPKVLLLDEPTAGMSPAETAQMVEVLAALPRTTTLVIIDHDMDVVAALADAITVLHHGELIADGPADEVRSDPRVQAVYFGSGEVA